jgi:hypothetical protein
MSTQQQSDIAAEKFERLARQWMAETAHLSRLDAVYMNSAYQQIIGMGEPALSYIFAALQKSRGRWFWALKAITGHEPFAGQDGITLEQMRSAWLDWGREHGYA